MSLLRRARIPALSTPTRPLSLTQPWSGSVRTFSAGEPSQRETTDPLSTGPPRKDADKSHFVNPAPVISPKGAAEGLPRHQPDYDVAVEYRTSRWSPIPKKVMDGGEEGDTAAAVISGAPVDLQARTVRIYKPVKPATQSGDWNGNSWRMDWDPLPKGHRWENPLIGWQSSADFMQSERLHFHSKDDAIRFANKNGYEYFVQEPNERKFVPKVYANNFLYSAKKLKQIRTK
ncbi:NADH-ubiquinone oxidoreductase 21 kDa subunit mitochondrial precursor [Eremomyces bilateralis CBS 781.70]|uniref:NADH dehydrogenase [ubiquinone] iron-sulfur protein 4, mitochondrial n=1 Tax=Eremomyces bilateralis CBS 781.70 TaxID=1392243 RepID=A0A6G1GFJ4_9PEZI|nr:NADH-ubiquinone oxidoreductase 21 kDa subunit mitochondrial precursor [Eremomyces bilateralis CBS 781.70]KAF1816823.1 NADH-ubiquinone oxidoreductase 21 kDa subunit mitochondrial precursor [Eremomyces bilateralis CBS 781.70]